VPREKNAAGTYNRHKSALSTCFREAQRAGKIVNNPMRLVRSRKEMDGRLRYLFDEEEVLLRETGARRCNTSRRLPSLAGAASGKWFPGSKRGFLPGPRCCCKSFIPTDLLTQ
jgi:hypothetical protein